LLTWRLIAAAEGQKSYQLFESWIGSAVGKFILLCYTCRAYRFIDHTFDVVVVGAGRELQRHHALDGQTGNQSRPRW
jgi:hypothetical protein